MSTNFVVQGKELEEGDVIFEKENGNYKFEVVKASNSQLILETIAISEKGERWNRMDGVTSRKFNYSPYDFSLVQSYFYFQL
jgi:hypothetical protein